ncbi:ABC transporter permease [Nakamurella sp. YIM 132087]|uniref:ABC transporter permease n=1 Tax=Nakamurella alba TaxID=2665158 RepID=A0A7K1FJ21_9ACTN|nr:ABC transporter permease [Nakamurella alba]MTD14112.1 ABC transporter permease [Nakamurella alba]
MTDRTAVPTLPTAESDAAGTTVGTPGAGAAVTSAAGRVRRRRRSLTTMLLAASAVLAAVAFSFSSPYFLSGDNLVNLMEDVALAGLLAVPATFLMMSGHVDLSVGAAAAFTGIVLAGTAPGSGMVVAVLLAVLTGLLIGLINGLLVTVAEVNSIAMTFAAMSLLRGLAYLIPSGLAISLPGFRALGNTRPFLGIGLPTLIFVVVLVAGLLLARSAVGRRSRRIGMMPAVGRLDRWPERRWVIGLFVVSGLAAALVGLIRTSQLGTGLPTAALGIELTVVTAVLLGGARMSGGWASVPGTMLALLTISIVDNGMSLANVTSYASQVFHAALLVLALIIDRPRRWIRRPREAAPEPAAT